MHYSRALKHAETHISAVSPDVLAALYGNRAFARLRAGDADGAETDCDRALMIRPTFLKARYRRALARKLTCQFDAAIGDLRGVLEDAQASDADRRDAQKALDEIQSELASLRLQEEVVYQRLKVSQSSVNAASVPDADALVLRVFWVACLLPPNTTSFSLTQSVPQNPCLQDNAAVAVGLDRAPSPFVIQHHKLRSDNAR